jgi:hypothetical protein
VSRTAGLSLFLIAAAGYCSRKEPAHVGQAFQPDLSVLSGWIQPGGDFCMLIAAFSRVRILIEAEEGAYPAM